MTARIMKFNLVGIVLLCLSGAEPARECPAAPVWLTPERAPLAVRSCPSGSCDGRRPG